MGSWDDVMVGDVGAFGGVREQGDELVATDASHDVRAAHLVLEHFGELTQEPIACVVAEAVVDGLEVVEIEVGECEWYPCRSQTRTSWSACMANPRRLFSPVRGSEIASCAFATSRWTMAARSWRDSTSSGEKSRTWWSTRQRVPSLAPPGPWIGAPA